MRHKFIRRNWDKYSRLGKGRKKKQIWRRPKGGHNKMRKYRRGYPIRPEIGMRKSRKMREQIHGFDKVIVKNLNDLKKAGKDNIIIIGKMGKKKRNEIMNEIEKMNLKVFKNEISKKDLWRKK